MRAFLPRAVLLALAAAVLTTGCAATAPPPSSGPPTPLRTGDLLRTPFAPVVRVLDSESSLGPLAREPQTVTFEDLVRYHGHPCDGLAVAAAGIAFGLTRLFPGGLVERTDLASAVNASACYGDLASYLTGTRFRYGSLVIDRSLGDEWVLACRSSQRSSVSSVSPS